MPTHSSFVAFKEEWWNFVALRLMHYTPDAPLHPGALSGNSSIPNFWTPLWASCSLTIQPFHLLSHCYSSPFSHCPLVPMSQHDTLLYD